MLCIEKSRKWLEEKKGLQEISLTHVLVLISANGTLRPYNKRLFDSEITKSCPRGFSYHVVLCSLDSTDHITQILDASLKRPTSQTFAQYVEAILSIPNQDESSFLYYCVESSLFLQALQQGFFDPIREMKNNPTKLMYA